MKPKVLISEGDVELCAMYQSLLTERGFEMETASNGLDCLAKLGRGMPAVLVLDRELHWCGGDGGSPGCVSGMMGPHSPWC